MAEREAAFHAGLRHRHAVLAYHQHLATAASALSNRVHHALCLEEETISRQVPFAALHHVHRWIHITQQQTQPPQFCAAERSAGRHRSVVGGEHLESADDLGEGTRLHITPHPALSAMGDPCGDRARQRMSWAVGTCHY
jgi:hypothetical protein